MSFAPKTKEKPEGREDTWSARKKNVAGLLVHEQTGERHLARQKQPHNQACGRGRVREGMSWGKKGQWHLASKGGMNHQREGREARKEGIFAPAGKKGRD